MALTDPTTTVIAALTNQARTVLAGMATGQYAFHLAGFQVGRGGYNFSNPYTTAPINPSAVALIDPIYPSSPLRPMGNSPEPFVALEVLDSMTIAPVCRLSTDVANYGLGELGIYAQYDMSIPNPSDAPEGYIAENFATTNGVLATFSGTNARPGRVKPSTFKILLGSSYIGIDDGSGAISGTGFSGTINYATGAVTLTFTTPPAGGNSIKFEYQTYGTYFLFAKVHFPFLGKTDKDVVVKRVVLAL